MEDKINQLVKKVHNGLAHCVDNCFYCVGCPYEELEDRNHPLQCIYALLKDIQKLRSENNGLIPPI